LTLSLNEYLGKSWQDRRFKSHFAAVLVTTAPRSGVQPSLHAGIQMRLDSSLLFLPFSLSKLFAFADFPVSSHYSQNYIILPIEVIILHTILFGLCRASGGALFTWYLVKALDDWSRRARSLRLAARNESVEYQAWLRHVGRRGELHITTIPIQS
jgi:hypothetical protein